VEYRGTVAAEGTFVLRLRKEILQDATATELSVPAIAHQNRISLELQMHASRLQDQNIPNYHAFVNLG